MTHHHPHQPPYHCQDRLVHPVTTDHLPCRTNSTLLNRHHRISSRRYYHHLLPLLLLLAISCIEQTLASDHCNNELVHRSDRRIQLSASSRISEDKSAKFAILHDTSAWTAAQNDLSQYLEVDLGQQYNISAIGTQGRQHTIDYVAEFRLESGIDGHDYNLYRDRNGNIKPSSWTAAFGNLKQSLTVDLGERMLVNSIATQGHANSDSYVGAYHVSASDDDAYWRSVYTDEKNANKELFQGNTDGNSVVINRFDPPIIARFIRINPARWGDKIAMRLQLYGCDYHAVALNFDGETYVKMNLDIRPIQSSYDDVFRFRFRTNEANGNILYGTGIQGDLLALQLINNKLLFSVNLGGDNLESISAGSLLDDNLWHDVFISRQGKEVLFSVDRVVVKHRLRTDFNRINLNFDLFIGGLPGHQSGFLHSRRNFTGCIENLSFNTTNIAYEIQHDRSGFIFTTLGNLQYSCDVKSVIPITFNTRESHLKVSGAMSSQVNTSLDFRTFNEDGLLVHHTFSSKGFFAMYLDYGKLVVKIQGVDPTTNVETPDVRLEPFERKLNDGAWHNVQIALSRNRILITLDGIPSTTIRSFHMTSGQQYTVGGGVHEYRGFIGCMRWIYIESRFINPEAFNVENIYRQQEGDISLKACQMIDRCHPNPCEHGGVCRQNNLGFVCDCGDSGYLGAVCHVARHPISCTAFMNDNPGTKREDIKLDVDGSGPLEPFWVTCLQTADALIETIVHHQNEAPQRVQGFSQPGAYIQEFKYDAPMEQIVNLVNRSNHCHQKIAYECRNARLLNSPSSLSTNFFPQTWWVSRDNKKMDYWGGSLPGTRKCKCGLYGNCYDPKKWCNCDAAAPEVTLVDEGDITQLEYLPVRQVHVGDTGFSSGAFSSFGSPVATGSNIGPSSPGERFGIFTLGPLICDGDKMFDDVVTFRYSDATIDVPLAEANLLAPASDIYLQFKTTAEFGVLFHATGPDDFIKLAIVDGRTIQFSYKIGRSSRQVSVEAASRLNDDHWHSVLVEKNKKEARLVIDGRFTNENRENADNSVPLYLTSRFVIGATTEYREGFVGCMRAFIINGRPLELTVYAKQRFYGISEGCVGKCQSGPCLNNGTCIERYNGYSCDCQWTAFKGPICADEIGVNLRSDYYIKYDLETIISTKDEFIRVGFTTTEHHGLIFGMSSYSNEYLNLLMSTSGHLRLVFDFGFERQEIIIKEENFALGQFHDITIRRQNHGSEVVVAVDNYEPKTHYFQTNNKADIQFNRIKSIYVGRNETMDSGDGFVGCISRVTFNDHFPLRRLFQEERKSNVRAFPTQADIFEDKCGIEPPTHPPEPIETRPPPSVTPGVHIDGGISTTATSAIIGAIIAALLVILLFACFASSRFVARQKGEYVTHEDQGAEAAQDPDTAVMQGTTGPDVSEKKEYFI